MRTLRNIDTTLRTHCGIAMPPENSGSCAQYTEPRRERSTASALTAVTCINRICQSHVQQCIR